mmetsp:Transcript_3051/g.9269  ORF Transcript_3051/g.9269 Transcript_3051/m.9269 type:complete len:264 (+) Transcript_3051:810-1601(+)
MRSSTEMYLKQIPSSSLRMWPLPGHLYRTDSAKHLTSPQRSDTMSCSTSQSSKSCTFLKKAPTTMAKKKLTKKKKFTKCRITTKTRYSGSSLAALLTGSEPGGSRMQSNCVCMATLMSRKSLRVSPKRHEPTMAKPHKTRTKSMLKWTMSDPAIFNVSVIIAILGCALVALITRTKITIAMTMPTVFRTVARSMSAVRWSTRVRKFPFLVSNDIIWSAQLKLCKSMIRSSVTVPDLSTWRPIRIENVKAPIWITRSTRVLSAT